MTNGSKLFDCIPTEVRHQILITWVQLKQMLQQQINAPQYGSENEVKWTKYCNVVLLHCKRDWFCKISIWSDFVGDVVRTAPINSRLNVVVRSPAPFGLGPNGCWPSRGSQVPRALPFIFSLCCPLNDRTRAAHSFFRIDRLFSLFLFS